MLSIMKTVLRWEVMVRERYTIWSSREPAVCIATEMDRDCHREFQPYLNPMSPTYGNLD